jgi:hypothetical protein
LAYTHNDETKPSIFEFKSCHFVVCFLFFLSDFLTLVSCVFITNWHYTKYTTSCSSLWLPEWLERVSADELLF